MPLSLTFFFFLNSYFPFIALLGLKRLTCVKPLSMISFQNQDIFLTCFPFYCICASNLPSNADNLKYWCIFSVFISVLCNVRLTGEQERRWMRWGRKKLCSCWRVFHNCLICFFLSLCSQWLSCYYQVWVFFMALWNRWRNYMSSVLELSPTWKQKTRKRKKSG